MQSRNGKLFRIDPDTGETDEIEIAGGSLVNGDGILLRGRTLYVAAHAADRVRRRAGGAAQGAVRATSARDAIMDLLGQRDAGKTICPSEAAREVGGERYRELMPAVRAAAGRLVDEGVVEVTQRGRSSTSTTLAVRSVCASGLRRISPRRPMSSRTSVGLYLRNVRDSEGRRTL